MELADWHHIVFERDLKALENCLADDVIFYSPFVWKPKEGKAQVLLLLGHAIHVFQDFAYHRELIQGNSWALEFSARVGDLSLKGIDLIGLNEAGKIQTFEVFVRPANGLQALGMAMMARLEQS